MLIKISYKCKGNLSRKLHDTCRTTYVLIENTLKCRWKNHTITIQCYQRPNYNRKPQSWNQQERNDMPVTSPKHNGRDYAQKSSPCQVIKIHLTEKRTIFFYFHKRFYIITRSPRTHLPLPSSPSLLFFTGKRTKSLGPRSPSVSILNSKIVYF